MAKPKFLSLDGVRTLVQWAKNQLATKVDKVAGKDLSDNNYSDDDVAKLESIENGAQENLIESIRVNGNAQAIDQKSVDIAIPLVDDTLTNSGQSADAKATGDAIAEVNQSLSQTAIAIRQEFDDADNQLAEEMTQALEELSGSIPTKTSELTNDSDYTTKGYVDDEIAGVESAIPTKTSQLQNDSDYTTKQYVDGELDTLEASIPTKVSQLQNDSSYATTTQLTDGLATKEDTLRYGTATAEDVGKAMMPKTVADGKVTSWEFGEAGKVDDVQVNGTSIVDSETGIAVIPMANSIKYGLVKPGAGLKIKDGYLVTVKATNNLVKEGTDIYLPLVPNNQHYAAFYGMAKAAGDITQSSSSNAIGQYTDEAKTAIQSMLGVPSENDIVTDVQVNGTSVITDGVAEIPIASTSVAGVMKVYHGDGLVIDNNGSLRTNPPMDSQIKGGLEDKRPLVSSVQHMSTFYGLAKAAGDTTQSASNNAVGTYTDEAKSAIKTMLGFATSSDISSAIDNLVNTRYHVCEPGEYNSTTYIPTLAGELGVIYLVPKPIGDTGISSDSITGTAQVGTATIATTNNIFYEYIYTGDKFEQIGDTKVDLTGYITDADIATDASVTTMLNQVFS